MREVKSLTNEELSDSKSQPGIRALCSHPEKPRLPAWLLKIKHAVLVSHDQVLWACWVFYVLGENPAVLYFFPPLYKRCNYSLVSRNLGSTLKEVPDWNESLLFVLPQLPKTLISWLEIHPSLTAINLQLLSQGTHGAGFLSL